MLVEEVVAVVSHDARDGRRGAVALLPLVDHRDVLELHGAVLAACDVRARVGAAAALCRSAAGTGRGRAGGQDVEAQVFGERDEVRPLARDGPFERIRRARRLPAAPGDVGVLLRRVGLAAELLALASRELRDRLHGRRVARGEGRVVDRAVVAAVVERDAQSGRLPVRDEEQRLARLHGPEREARAREPHLPVLHDPGEPLVAERGLAGERRSEERAVLQRGPEVAGRLCGGGDQGERGDGEEGIQEGRFVYGLSGLPPHGG